MPFEVGAPFVRHALPPEESAPISSSALAWPRNTPAGWRRPSSNRAEPTLPAAVHQHSLASEASDDDASVFSDRLIRHALLRQAVRLVTVWTPQGDTAPPEPVAQFFPAVVLVAARTRSWTELRRALSTSEHQRVLVRCFLMGSLADLRIGRFPIGERRDIDRRITLIWKARVVPSNCSLKYRAN